MGRTGREMLEEGSQSSVVLLWQDHCVLRFFFDFLVFRLVYTFVPLDEVSHPSTRKTYLAQEAVDKKKINKKTAEPQKQKGTKGYKDP